MIMEDRFDTSDQPEISASGVTYDFELLEKSYAKWRASTGIRVFYRGLFREIMSYAVTGPTLELGSGIGVIKTIYDDVTTSDLRTTPFVDTNVSCYEVEQTQREWSNILAIDVLHHLRFPLQFLASAAATLRPGGRVLLAEPAATPFGRAFYRCFHHEPVDPSRIEPPFRLAADNAKGEFANMGMSKALFETHWAWVRDQLSAFGLSLAALLYRDFLAYPLTGGFSRPQLLPTGLLRIFLELEKMVPQPLMRVLALRVIIVLEKGGGRLEKQGVQ